MTPFATMIGPGLSDEDAAGRWAEDGPNELPVDARRSLARQVVDVLREPMLLLLVAAGAINVMLAELLDGLILLVAVFVVVGISIAQEHKTENALVALRDLSSPRALVVRGGRQLRIAGRDVVRGDVVLLSEGDRVPADSVLVDAVNCTVDEAALTGESVPVRKSAVPAGTDATAVVDGPAMGPPGGDGTPWVFSGTLVVKGRAVAVVRATGARTELGRIGSALRDIETERTPLQREIDRLVRVVAVLGLSAAAAVVIADGVLRGGWLDALLVGIATAMSMLPEEFPVVLMVFLALGAWRMSQRQVLVRRSAVIETLGSATVLCVDKTGTLTMNRMEVRELFAGAERHVLDDGELPEAFHLVAEFAVLASPVDPFDPVDRAFATLGQRWLRGTEHLHGDWQLVREYPLSEELLALSHVWRSPDSSRYVVAAKGAPEAIADLCHLDAEANAALAAQVANATADGLRVLGVARARFDSAEQLPTGQHDFDFEFLGLAGLHDPVRAGAAAAVDECRRAGVRTVMITGDAPGTALAVARAVGIDTTGGCLTGPELARLGHDELVERVPHVCVYARMVPDQKLQLVRALRSCGEVVGMTGDGVNDAPALRAADIGIAMGERGTDVAREAAALVITDDDMSSIAGGIRRGRGIFDNLRKAMAYIVAVHVSIVGMALVPVFVESWPLVLLPVQLALLELVIDPACSVVFEAEQIDPEIMSHPPRRPGEPVLGRRVLVLSAMQGLSVLAVTLLVYLWGVHRGLADTEVRSIAFAALVLGNLQLILVNRSWRLGVWRTWRERHNPALRWILMVTIGLLVLLLSVPPLRSAFGLGPIGLLDAAVVAAASAVGVAWFEAYKLVTHRGHPGE
ncbi:MAG: cation-translocating P-type ATPase [Acidimicrobiales bacterium]